MKKERHIAVILPLIGVIRGQRVILDADLARLYGVSTSRLNQQLRRNRRRFPPDFAFVLTRAEVGRMLSQFVTASTKRNRGKPPIAYTEHGAIMAANVLNSERAVVMSVEVIRAFVQLRRISVSHQKIARILAELEVAISQRLNHHDREIAALFEMMEALFVSDSDEPIGGRRVGSA